MPNTITARKKISNDIIKQVSKELHHTSSICKKSYLNKDLIDTYINSPNKFNTYFIKNKNSNQNNFVRFLVANN
jgi:DNA topoisomerase IB